VTTRQPFDAFAALDADDTPDVANYMGYTARKMGDYQLSKYWYERALANDPKHVRTWQYYGMWQVEQGNMLKAADYLENIRPDLRHHLQGIPGPQGRHGRYGRLLAPVVRAQRNATCSRWARDATPSPPPSPASAIDIAWLAAFDRQHQDRGRRIGVHLLHGGAHALGERGAGLTIITTSSPRSIAPCHQ